MLNNPKCVPAFMVGTRHDAYLPCMLWVLPCRCSLQMSTPWHHSPAALQVRGSWSRCVAVLSFPRSQ